MERPLRRLFAAGGLVLAVSACGCRSMRPRVPPEPSYPGSARQSQAQFSTEPPPLTNPAALGTNQPGQPGGMPPSGMMSATTPHDPAELPAAGLGTPASNRQTVAPADSPGIADPGAFPAPN